MSEETPNITPPPIATETVPNFLWQSIVVTILCCLPLGIPAIIFAAKVNGLVASGNIDEAKAVSAKAKMWCWISFGLGIVGGLISATVQILAFVGVAAAEGY